MVGYYVADKKLNEEAIQNYLSNKLPEYMVPSVLVHIEKLPLTINGKLDRKALPDPEFTSQEHYVAPRNELESKVCQIWAEVLGLAEGKVGIQDDFFRLGGDSIISIQLVSKLRQRLGLTISVKDIFNYRNIERLYDNAIGKELDNVVKKALRTEQGVLSGELGLLPIQQWFFDNNFRKAEHWNQSFLLRTPKLDIGKLKESIEKLIVHHDSFRLRYKKKTASDGNEYIQYYDDTAGVIALKILDIRNIGRKEGTREFEQQLRGILTEWQSGFNLEEGPLYQIGYIEGYEDGSSRLYFALHHLIVDAVSWRILAEDIRDIYEGKELGTKGSSYRQWVEAVSQYREDHQKEIAYWENVLVDYNSNSKPLLDLVGGEELKQVSIGLSQKQTKQLLQESNRTYHTQINDILLTALGYALTEISGKRVNHIVLEGHGREEIDDSIDITRTLGWFTTMYPIRLEVRAELGDSIKYIKESLRQVPNKGIGYALNDINDLPRVSFNYLGQFDKGDKEEAGLQLWNIIEESSGASVHGDNKDHNIININGLVIDGKLQFSIRTRLGEFTTQRIAKALQGKLEEIISYTTNCDRSYITTSDIGKLLSQPYLDKLQEEREIQDIFLANSLQQGFISHALSHDRNGNDYSIQMIWKYNCKINLKTLKEAWAYTKKKYPAFRLRFAWQEKLIQIVDKEGYLDWRLIDLSAFTPKLQRSKIQEILRQDKLEVFNFDKSGMFRVYIIKETEKSYTCIFSFHHVLFDGWSNPIILDFLHKTYSMLLTNDSVNIIEDSSYYDSQKYLASKQDSDLSFWRKYLQQMQENANINFLSDKEPFSPNYLASKSNLKQDEKFLVISNYEFFNLKKLSQEHGITLNAIFQYFWHKTLSLYCHSSQTVVGTIVSGRDLPIDGIDASIGLFINTLPLLVDHNQLNDLTIIQAIKSIQDNVIEINTHSNVSLAKLQRGSEPLFGCLFSYQNYPQYGDKESQKQLKYNFVKAIETPHYPISIVVSEENNSIIFKLRRMIWFCSEKVVYQLFTTIKILLMELLEDCHKKVASLNYIPDKGYNGITTSMNYNSGFLHIMTLHNAFEMQVEKTPLDTAVLFNDRHISFSELNEKANQLARYLVELGIKEGSPVVISLEKSIKMIIAIIAVLKAGGAYVPVDPNYPVERFQYILKDTQAQIIFTDSSSLEKIPFFIGFVINLSDGLENFIHYPKNNLQNKIPSNNLAYVIYTSGSTGKPKGVMVEHGGVFNLIKYLTQKYSLGGHEHNEVILQFSNFTFDASVEQIFLALLNGYVLLLPSATVWQNKREFYTFLSKNKVTHIHATPRFLKEYDFRGIKSIRRIISGGDELDSATFKSIKYDKGVDLINEYGPTEASITSTTNIILNKNLSIGEPIINNKCYILDNNLSPLPPGAIGNLYISGIGISRGYLNKPELTAEVFVANPFLHENSYQYSRMYKTGDLVKLLPSGDIQYIGRDDMQVKVSGYRIELSEIESLLLGFEGIKECTIAVKENNNLTDGSLLTRVLVAYYTSDIQIVEEKIIQFLGNNLPDYMIPKIFIRIQKLPLSSNGKLDKKSLPNPEFVNNYVAPSNEWEQQMCKIWADVLHINPSKVGIKDDFFKLGGNSILAINLISSINSYYNSNLQISDLFVNSRVELILPVVAQTKNSYQPIIKLNNTEDNPIMFMIHPGLSGCEVYSSLSKVLNNHFSCYGIDSYNLYNKNKINDLNKLASFYLGHIKNIMKEKKQEEYNLLGWSLGGFIALEIASILEKNGVSNVKIYLLDTIVNHEIALPKASQDNLKKIYKREALSKGFGEQYIDKILANADLEDQIVKQEISKTLSKAQIVLFKAMIFDTDIKDKEIVKLQSFIKELKYNNIDQVANISNIKLVPIHEARHDDILKFEEKIKLEILSFLRIASSKN